jgi:hypothetical protein
MSPGCCNERTSTAGHAGPPYTAFTAAARLLRSRDNHFCGRRPGHSRIAGQLREVALAIGVHPRSQRLEVALGKAGLLSARR